MEGWIIVVMPQKVHLTPGFCFPLSMAISRQLVACSASVPIVDFYLILLTIFNQKALGLEVCARAETHQR